MKNEIPTLSLPDVEEARVGLMTEFLRAQPVKYLRQFLMWTGGSVVVLVGAGFAVGHWSSGLQSKNEITQLRSDLNTRNAVAAGEQATRIAQVNADWESRLAKEVGALRQEINDLKVANSALSSKVGVAEASSTATASTASRREMDLNTARTTIASLQASLAASEQRGKEAAELHRQQMQAALKCTELKAEADQITERSRKAQEHITKTMGYIETVAALREAENRSLQVQLGVIQHLMGACGR